MVPFICLYLFALSRELLLCMEDWKIITLIKNNNSLRVCCQWQQSKESSSMERERGMCSGCERRCRAPEGSAQSIKPGPCVVWMGPFSSAPSPFNRDVPVLVKMLCWALLWSSDNFYGSSSTWLPCLSLLSPGNRFLTCSSWDLLTQS